MKIIDLKFTPKSCTILMPESCRIKPRVLYTLTVMNAAMNIEFVIDDPNVNLVIKNPKRTLNTGGTDGNFKEEILFELRPQGVKKKFNLLLTASLSASESRTIELPIIYK